jgi:hypothetical protein
LVLIFHAAVMVKQGQERYSQFEESETKRAEVV